MVPRPLKYYIYLEIGPVVWVYGKAKKHIYNLLADMFAQSFIDFGDLGLIKSVGKIFRHSLLIVF